MAVQPLVDGVVSDFEITEHMLRSFVRRIHRMHRVLSQRPRMIVGLPSGVTEVERRAVEEAARSAGAKRVYLIEEPIAAAIGSGLDIHKENAVMIIDIGGGTTEIAVIANGSSIISRSIRIAGDELTAAIISFMRDEFNQQIGVPTAEDIKINIGMVGGKMTPRSMIVRGRNTVTGLPIEIELSSDMIRGCMTRQLRPIVDAIRSVLDEVPTEVLSDIMDNGIHLAGGGALITGIDRYLRSETHVTVRIAENALTAVVEGAARVLADPQKYRQSILIGH
jgi:rod shape-determining protein MreB